MHCHMARRNRIPDDVGFDYDEFEDFVSTPTSQEEKEEKARRRKKAEEEDAEDYVHISHIPAPPDPREDVPAVFSYFSPLYGNKAEEAKALALQRAYARQLWEEYGELPDRSRMWTWKREGDDEDDEEARLIAGEAAERKEERKFVRDADGNKVRRPVNDAEYNYEVSRIFNTWREKEHTYPQKIGAPRMDPYRLREKFGMRPTVEGKMTYPDFIELMHKGRVGRLLHYDQGTTIIVVSHDRRVARATDRILTMRDGRITNDHTVADPLTEDLRELGSSRLGQRLLMGEIQELGPLSQALVRNGRLTPEAEGLVNVLRELA